MFYDFCLFINKHFIYLGRRITQKVNTIMMRKLWHIIFIWTKISVDFQIYISVPWNIFSKSIIVDVDWILNTPLNFCFRLEHPNEVVLPTGFAESQPFIKPEPQTYVSQDSQPFLKQEPLEVTWVWKPVKTKNLVVVAVVEISQCKRYFMFGTSHENLTKKTSR